jgi:tRNA nucleotidyltransferase (CCA-adding enzyme)
MCLGIYEDTGSFTFPSTTEKDFNAAAYLVSKGANLNIISNLISREITTEQVSLLNEMIQATTRHHIAGIEVLVTTVTSDSYVPDFAFLVHKMVKMENTDAIFAIAGMENKVYIVARSRIPEVDVGEILNEMGGGGHASAAAASIKGKTLVQVENQLIELLYTRIKSRRLARDLMSSPAIAVPAGISCRRANELLTRYNINALLVTENSAQEAGNGKLAGYITRQVIEKALYHKLDQVPISEYMTTELVVVEPEAGLSEIQDKIIENKQRILPVMQNGDILGVITRTDLLDVLVHKNHRSESKMVNETVNARTRNVSKFMRERLPAPMLDKLAQIGQVADEIGCTAYVVGGFVRDLFMFRNNEDLDIVIEGDGIRFAQRFAELAGARIHAYAKFGTAVIIFPNDFKIDVASARMEYYKFPAALPIVEMSSIKLDLFRRDFTVNTLAIQLNQKHFGTLIDFFAAQRDIKEKTIRVLHNLSFVEDPTRVFRAIRFEQRFGFTIGKLTLGLIENAVKMDFFKRLSGRRVFSELRQILEEENPSPALVRLDEFNLLEVIHPTIQLNSELITLFNAVKKVLSWYDLLFLEESYMKWAVYFLALIRQCDRQISDEICLRLEMAPRLRKIFTIERFQADDSLISLERGLPSSNSELYAKLIGFKTELILYMMAATRKETVKRAISHFITNLKDTTISIRGDDLRKMGLAPGPIYRRILDRTLNAKLNGQLHNRADELKFAKRTVQELIETNQL